MNILFIADIIGKPGFEITALHLQSVKEKHDIHVTIANGENSAAGKGMTTKIAQSYFDMGIDVITTGNHIWNRENFFPTMNANPNILRPINYPPGCPGHGSCIFEIDGETRIGVINLQGRSFMYPIDCPFRCAEGEIQRLRKEGIRIIFIDFHAEATAEKIALGWYFDGQVSVIVGSHTHVQTADEKILPEGTAYITDAGMTGPFNSVIGMQKDIAIHRFLTQLPVHYQVAEGDCVFCGIVAAIDKETGRSRSIFRFQIPQL